MPTYEYQCEKCGITFEFFQSMNDTPLKVCPKNLCPRKAWGRGKVKRLIGGGAGLLFKGSGFYTTDYRSDSYKSAASKESPPAAAASSGGGETKPAPAAPAVKTPSSNSTAAAAPTKPTGS